MASLGDKGRKGYPHQKKKNWSALRRWLVRRASASRSDLGRPLRKHESNLQLVARLGYSLNGLHAADR